MGTGVDNIEVDPLTGDLWIGCHPLNWAILDFFDLFGFDHPSQVRLQRQHHESIKIGWDRKIRHEDHRLASRGLLSDDNR